MRIRLIKSLKGGETLAEPVITKEKEVLISKGTVLKPEYLDLMSFLGIDTVCIEDPYESYEEVHQILDREKINNYISKTQAILESHIYHGEKSLEKMKPLSEELVKDILNAECSTVIDMGERSGNLYEHTVMVTILALLLAKKLKQKEDVLYRISLGCLLHDLGIRYITVPYLNCDFTNSSSAQTFEFKKHTILAYSALEGETWLGPIEKKMILSHHERKDGSGFPLRQKTKETECNILQVCDAFDCMISGMECRRVTVQQALEYLVETSDVLFEARIVKMLQKSVARYPAGTVVRLNTGEMGIVVSQSKDPIRPVVLILDEAGNVTEKRHYLEKEKDTAIIHIEE
uniref:HD-GYP domain-containing protein n=1 Tax=Roseburia sp. TaxID=2049040 RepID=UPI003FEEB9AE